MLGDVEYVVSLNVSNLNHKHEHYAGKQETQGEEKRHRQKHVVFALTVFEHEPTDVHSEVASLAYERCCGEAGVLAAKGD